MKREELEKMEKDALIDICIKQESELDYRNRLYKWQSEENEKLKNMIAGVQLILNNVKK